MKKIINPILLLLLATSNCSYIYGKTVDETTAKTIGSNFLAFEGVQVNPGVLTTAYTATANIDGKTVNHFYVFTASGSKGWVIVSADDNIAPVLAYSGSSSFDINNMAPSTEKWLSGYQNQITYVLQNNIPARAGTADKWDELKNSNINKSERTTGITVVGPLLSTIWNQYPNYNALCPYDGGSGQQTVTGCVATAMAQVMKYWNWPTRGCGSHAYIDGSYGVLSANFGATAYQWSAMPANITDSNNAVATLMYEAGVSVDMGYGTVAEDGSGAYVNLLESTGTPCAEFALRANFHYKPSLHSLYRFGPWSSGVVDTIPEATWISTLQTELNARRPIIYVGDESSGGGHCWVCDGYEITTSNYFHFNWGWSGASDGYYTVDNLAPPALGAGGGDGNFNFDQTAIVGIEPDSFPSNPGNIQLLSYLNASNTPVEYAQPFSISTKIFNADSATSFSGDFCAQVYDTSNAFVTTLQTITGTSIAAGDSTSTLVFGTTGMYNLTTGIYDIRIFYRPTGTSGWTPVANNGTFINYTTIAVANDTDIELANPIDIAYGPALSQGSPVGVTANISNWGSYTFYGSIEATLNSVTDGSLVFTIQELTGQEISGWGSTPNTYTFTNSDLAVPLGTYLLEIQHQYNGVGSYYLTGSTNSINPVLVTVVKATGVQQVSSANNITIYPNPANDVINIDMHGVAATQVHIMDIQGREMQNIDADNQSVVTIPVGNYAAGLYFVQVQTGNGVVTRKFVVTK